MKIRSRLLILTSVLICAVLALGPIFIAYGNEPMTLERGVFSETEKKSDPLKIRQTFNKLKRTTQNIYKVTMRSTVAFRLQTALGYVSTIDLPEPAQKVFVGDQELFKVEVYERQVLVKPITDETDARSNLVIVTASNRLAFDVSVGPPDTADFVLDFRLPKEDEALVKNAFEERVKEKTDELEEVYQERSEELNEQAEKLSEEKLLEKVASGVQTIELRKSEAEEDVQVNLLSLSQVADKAYLRFSVLNYSRTPFKVLKVLVGAVSHERKFLRNKETGVIELPSELELPETISPDAYEYGVLVFDYRVLGKKQKPFIRILEDSEMGKKRDIEIKGFKWFE